MSRPTLRFFNPTIIPYQYQVIEDIRRNFDYSQGNHEIMLSGSYGSAKSILMAHIAVTHCMENPKACVCLARKAMPDLKATIYREIIDHISKDMKEGVDYWTNITTASIGFRNGSAIISRSCSDKKYTKPRSLKLSMVVIEELIELNDDDEQFFNELKSRLRRIPGIKENVLIAATNPDSPAHWAYKYFIETKKPTRHVYYSRTTDNPFLEDIYIEQLREDLDPIAARRYIHGEWIELAKEIIYYSYTQENNYCADEYTVAPAIPLHLSFDFNIGEGKPLSAVCFQFSEPGGTFHFFDECIVEGMRTKDAMIELDNRGILDLCDKIIIHGDATGRHKDTRSNHSDYDIIKAYLQKSDRSFEMQVAKSNPPIRKRHNLVNAYCENDLGQHRLKVYKKAKTIDKGLRLTGLKKGGQYIEDDSKAFQHCTTAVGYGIYQALRWQNVQSQGTRRL